MDFGAIVSGQALCVFRGKRFDYPVPALGENHLRQLAHVGFVFDKQDGFVALARRGCRRFRRRRLDGIFDARLNKP